VTALVFNCHYNGLAIIRELGRRGVEVFALDSARSVGTRSKYCRYVPCPDPLVAEADFVALLMEIGRSLDEKPVLFPTNDHFAAAVSRHKQELERYFLPCVADGGVVELLLHKSRFYRWASAAGYPVPRSWIGADYAQIPADSFPVVAKPEYRRISDNNANGAQRAARLDSLRLTVIADRSALELFVASHQDMLPSLLFQEYVRGMSDCMYTVGVYAARGGEVLGLFTGRKVRGFPPDSGDCFLGQAEEVPIELKDMVRRLCRDLGYQGIGEFEFKRDAVTGRHWLIEVNPRSWSWVGITPACGVSLPWLAYADLTGREVSRRVESDAATASVKWVRVFDDFLNCVLFNRRAGFPQWHMTVPEWWDSIRAEHLVAAEFSWDDPLPAFYAFRDKVGPLFAAARRKLA
jgi:predicted ATP-grasp superfamily ATP-dependent carboligase